MKLTVIIPTYNGEKVLGRAIESVQNQTFKCDCEIIICDDCSTDNTLNIARRYKCKIIVNERHTGGPNKGRNNGLKNATGEFIAFLDQDDEWLPNKLELQFKEFENGADFVYSSYHKKKD